MIPNPHSKPSSTSNRVFVAFSIFLPPFFFLRFHVQAQEFQTLLPTSSLCRHFGTLDGQSFARNCQRFVCVTHVRWCWANPPPRCGRLLLLFGPPCYTFLLSPLSLSESPSVADTDTQKEKKKRAQKRGLDHPSLFLQLNSFLSFFLKTE